MFIKKYNAYILMQIPLNFQFLVNQLEKIKTFFIFRDAFVVFKSCPSTPPEETVTLLQNVTEVKEIHDIYKNVGRNYRTINSIITSRLKKGYRFFTLSYDHKIIFTVWMTSKPPRFIDELAISINLENNRVWIRDSFCVEEYRGKGYFSRGLSVIISEYFLGATHVYSDTVISNKISNRAHEKYGFKPQFKIRYAIILKIFLIRIVEKNKLNLDIYQDKKLIVIINKKFKRYVAKNMA